MNDIAESQMLAYTKIAEYKTNHILHLILTLATAGVWSWVWLIIAAGNITKRNGIKKKAGLKREFNLPKLLLVANFIFWVFIIWALTLPTPN